MHELCLLGGSHKTKTTPYHPESDGLVERFNRTLLMMLAMFAGEHKDDWDDLYVYLTNHAPPPPTPPPPPPPPPLSRVHM